MSKIKNPYWRRKLRGKEFFYYTQKSDLWGCSVWELDWVRYSGDGISRYWMLEYAEGLITRRNFKIPPDRPELAKRWATKIIKQHGYLK